MDTINQSWPKISQWLRIAKILSLKEKFLFGFLLFVFLGSSASWGILSYFSKTKAVSDFGGEYIEGIVGQPLHINPVLSATNATDADLARLIYSGLMKYDKDGKIVPDLAEKYELSEDKTLYTVTLRQNVTWHDDKPFSADDVIFTINLLSDPGYKSPLRSNWQGITTTKKDAYTLEFKIEEPYVRFLTNLTFGILPKHHWENLAPESFSLNSLNLKPIGTGPYKYSSIQKDSNDNLLSYKLICNPTYFEGKPFISKLTFNFYTDEDMAINALKSHEIMGINALSPEKIKNVTSFKSLQVHQFEIPRYFAVFFNQTKSIPIASDEVRKALSYATNQQEIVEKVLENYGKPARSPFLPGMVGYAENLEYPTFNLDKANEILDQSGWARAEDGTRAKDGEPLEINLVTTEWEDLVETAEIIKSQWEHVGARVNISPLSLSDFQENHIRPREYEALLFGQIVGSEPDPYSFWHSNQKKDPGLNLSLFDNEDADELIDNARKEFDNDKRNQNYIDFQNILIQENPAVFLYSPNYIYPVNKKIQGIDIRTLISPAGRFSDINHWYIKTKRVKK